MNSEKSKKIKSQKNSAILMIIVPLIILITYMGKTDLDKYGINNYVICGALLVIITLGIIGLNNSLRKQKEMNE